MHTPLHISDLPLELIATMIELACETYALDWYNKKLHGEDSDNRSLIFPLFQKLRHPCLSIIPAVCSRWKTAANLVKRGYFSHFMRLELSASSKSSLDLVERITLFSNALRISTGTDEVPLYISLDYGNEELEENLVRLFMYGAGKIVSSAAAIHVHALDLSFPGKELAIRHAFFFLYALGAKGCKLSHAKVHYSVPWNGTALNPSSFTKKAVAWSVGLYHDDPFTVAISGLREGRKGDGTTVENIPQKPMAVYAFPSIVNRSVAAKCLSSLGDLEYGQEKYKEGGELFKVAENLFRSVGDRFNMGRCLRSLGECEFLQNKYDEAEELLKEARNVSQSIGDEFNVGWCVWCLGKLDYNRGFATRTPENNGMAFLPSLTSLYRSHDTNSNMISML